MVRSEKSKNKIIKIKEKVPAESFHRYLFAYYNNKCRIFCRFSAWISKYLKFSSHIIQLFFINLIVCNGRLKPKLQCLRGN